MLGEDFVDTLQDRQEPGGLAAEVGRLDDAFALTKEIDARYERGYEPNHPDPLACKLNLACDLSARDEKTPAFEVASRVLEAYQSTIGGTHPFTLVAENNISTYLRGSARCTRRSRSRTGR